MVILLALSCTLVSDAQVSAKIVPDAAGGDTAIGNQAPSAPTVSIAPVAPTDIDVLTCVIEDESVDPEGAAVTYNYAWSVDGTDAGITGATVAGSLTTRGQTWTCSATGTDGEDISTPGSASVVIASCGEPQTIGGIDFTAVCAGTFEMGCRDDSPDCEASEVPVHSVTLTNDYLMSVTEVTQSQFSAIMGQDPSYFTSCGSDCPVERVSWHVAASFANALSDEAGLDSCYTCTGSGSSVSCTESGTPYVCDGFRLPTSAEWEAAARCETDTHYAGADEIDLVGWYGSNSFGMTHPVGELLPNACGIYDLTGNVWEWTSDWYMPYSSESVTDPVQPVGAHREFRGGSYDAGASDSHISHRAGIDPTYSAPNYGIRLVRIVRTDTVEFTAYATDYGSAMLPIPAGTFSMGSSSYGPIHSVTLTHDFWMGQTEVTQAQWAAWTSAPATPGSEPSFHESCAGCPVEGVDWADVAMYANAMSAAEGLNLCYTADGSDLAADLAGDPYECEGYRLPTEEEWEYAAGAGEGYVYSGSNTADDVAWTFANSGGETHEVATLAANAWGLYDMSGNVFEWTGAWMNTSTDQPNHGYDETVPLSATNRVVRGGWYGDTQYAGVTERTSADIGLRYYNLGFRLVRSYVGP